MRIENEVLEDLLFLESVIEYIIYNGPITFVCMYTFHQTNFYYFFYRFLRIKFNFV